MEVINLLVAFCSTQLYTAHATAYPGAHPFTEVLMKPPFNGCVLPPALCCISTAAQCNYELVLRNQNLACCRRSVSAPAVVQVLLHRYMERPLLPARSPLWIPPELPKGSAVMRFVRTAAGADCEAAAMSTTLQCQSPPYLPMLHHNPHAQHAAPCQVSQCRMLLNNAVQRVVWLTLLLPCFAASVMWLPYQAYSLLVRSAAQSSSPLAETSELFLLLLAFHAPVQGDAGANPYLQALRNLQVRLLVLLLCDVTAMSLGRGGHESTAAGKLLPECACHPSNTSRVGHFVLNFAGASAQCNI